MIYLLFGHPQLLIYCPMILVSLECAGPRQRNGASRDLVGCIAAYFTLPEICIARADMTRNH